MLKSKLILVISFIILLSSCYTIKAPQGSVPKRGDITTDAFGGWIALSLTSGQSSIEGEFIAVSNDSLYVIVGDKVERHAIRDISSARVVLFNTESNAYAIWTFLGSVATISTGSFIIFTLPIWLISGTSITTAEASRINFYDYPDYNWEQLIKYARFPQGMPQGMDIIDLKPRFIPKH